MDSTTVARNVSEILQNSNIPYKKNKDDGLIIFSDIPIGESCRITISNNFFNMMITLYQPTEIKTMQKDLHFLGYKFRTLSYIKRETTENTIFEVSIFPFKRKIFESLFLKICEDFQREVYLQEANKEDPFTFFLNQYRMFRSISEHEQVLMLEPVLIIKEKFFSNTKTLSGIFNKLLKIKREVFARNNQLKKEIEIDEFLLLDFAALFRVIELGLLNLSIKDFFENFEKRGESLKISFIGAGAMASAMIKCILSKGISKPEEIMGSGPRLKTIQELEKLFSVKITQKNSEATEFGEIIVLSIKPQVFNDVSKELVGKISKEKIVISIMAGIDIESIKNSLEHQKIVRAMPNTPAQIGYGMTVWTTNNSLSEDEIEKVQMIFRSMGKEFFVKEETYVDMATALSGTGPAYTFLFFESLINAGVHLGFSRKDAIELVYETVLGSVLFAMNSQKHTAELRDLVTSPGGTAADALYELEKGGFRTVIEKAVYSAYKKTIYLKELNKKKGGFNGN